MDSQEELRNLSVSSDSRPIPDIISRPSQLNRRRITQSQRLPNWLWIIIAGILGIKLQQNEKPIVSTILYTLTLASGLGYIFTSIWYSIFDILSNYTKTTVIEGCSQILFTILWVALGIYANRLAYRLFSHKKFRDMIRLHSKTILTINVAVMLFMLMFSLIVVSNISGVYTFYDSSCERVGIEVVICKIVYTSRVMYSVFSMVWNFLVGFAVTSACRTHTISIRKFMKLLEKDSKIYEQSILTEIEKYKKYSSVTEEEDQDGSDSDYSGSVEVLPPADENLQQDPDQDHDNLGSDDVERADIQSPPRRLWRGPRTRGSINAVLDFIEDSPVDEAQADVSPVKSEALRNSELLLNYWKIQCRLQLTATAFQRWMASVVSLVIIWLAMNLVLWLNYDPTILDLANFFLPLLILPILSSSYAEVNLEGKRLLKFIFPCENRLDLMYVIQQTPIEMTVFGYTLSYSTITTVAFGLLLAFASKILLQEIGGA